MANSSIDTMLRKVSHVLGNSRDIKEIESPKFYRKTQHLVDSEERSTGLKEKIRRRSGKKWSSGH